MSITARKATAAVLATGLFAFSSAAMATNGYFTHGVGTASKGMAGTGVGSNADMGAIMSPSNPALGVFTDDNWEIGLSVFSPMRSYTAFGSQLNGNLIDLGNGEFLPSFTIGENGKVDSSSEFFPIPYVAKNWSLQNDANVTFSFYGRGGMNTDWDSSNATATSYFCGGNPLLGEPPATGPGPYCAGDAGVDLMQAFLAVNYSAKVGENFAWGIGPVFAVQLFEAKGIATFAPVSESFAASGGTQFPSSLSDNGHDTSTGFGFAGGLWWGISDGFSLGLAYQSKMSMSEFDDYSDLFAEQGGFDIPSSIKLGLSFKASDALRVNLDIEEIKYSEVDSIANPMANLVSCPTLPLGGTDLSSCLGGNSGAGFGWEDMTVYKFGLEWMANENNTWRFGYSFGDQPIQPADVLFNVLAPGVMEQHITLGLTTRRASGGAWNFSFMYAPKETVSGPSMFDQTQTIELEMSQLEFEVGFTF
ncbi:MAG: outer membrane protein transport protein [Gammaproteobacteria bacterium]|nr:outer membrane protein transport protein [Gammaproteobacteria bacterium]